VNILSVFGYKTRAERLDNHLFERFGELPRKTKHDDIDFSIKFLAEDVLCYGTIPTVIHPSYKPKPTDQCVWHDMCRHTIRAGSPVRDAGNYFPSKWALFEGVKWPSRGWACGSSLDLGWGVRQMGCKVVDSIDQLPTEKAKRLARFVIKAIDKQKVL
jgi:hypothetical protein